MMIKMQNTILFIDSSDNKKTTVKLNIDGKTVQITKETSVYTSQVLLPLIERILKENSIALANLKKIVVKTGKGSFTGIRVGLAIGQTLGKLLDVPVEKDEA
jgi:tRNA threonylcarbamoyladenosine biosynthesis protein TsaB